MTKPRLALLALLFCGLSQAAAFDDNYLCTNADPRGYAVDPKMCPSPRRLYEFELRRLAAEGPDLRSYEYDAAWSKDDGATKEKFTNWQVRVIRQWKASERTHTRFKGPDVMTGVTWFQVTESSGETSYWAGDSSTTRCPDGKTRQQVYRMNCERKRP